MVGLGWMSSYRSIPRAHRDVGLVFLLGALVRALYLLELAASPAFEVPLLDEQRYHELAVALSTASQAPSKLFWQSPLYPQFVWAAYELFDASLPAVKVVHAFIDAGTGGLGLSAFGWLPFRPPPPAWGKRRPARWHTWHMCANRALDASVGLGSK